MVALLERYGLAFGADTNAFTGREVVGYQLDLPSNSDQMLNVGLFLMRETASELTFDSDAIDREPSTTSSPLVDYRVQTVAVGVPDGARTVAYARISSTITGCVTVGRKDVELHPNGATRSKS